MTLFVNKQKITGKETEQLFSAGISLLLSKAYPAAYSCFNRISDEDFSVPYNKALCCFMVKWHDECYRLLCESEQLMSGRNITREAELPEAFLRYDHAEGHPFHPHAARYSGMFGIQAVAAVKGRNGFQTTSV